MSEWRKSSYSGSGNCVEVADDDGLVRVRDSKDLPGPVLTFSTEAWVEFLRSMKDVPTKVPDLTGVPLRDLADGDEQPRASFSSSI